MSIDRDDDYTARDYEREARATRRRLAQSLDELNDRLTPGQVFDEMLSYARGGSGTFMRAFGNAARDNPVPSLLIGAGCMLFLSDKLGLSSRLAQQAARGGEAAKEGIAEGVRSGMDSASSGMRSGMDHASAAMRNGMDSASSAAGRAGESVKSAFSSAANAVTEKAARAGEAVGDMASSAAGGMKRAADAVGQGAAGIAETVTEGGRGLGDAALDYGAAAADQAAEAAKRARKQASSSMAQLIDGATTLVREQPLLAAGIAIAVGAAIAASLPATEAENELMGETSDAVKDTAGEIAGEQMKTARAKAEAVGQHAAAAAQKEGLTPAGAADLARDVGERVKRVVSETVSGMPDTGAKQDS
jgi:ElaB/YqjD/DUF883 family membrane-anchored ribosome-binding protein